MGDNINSKKNFFQRIVMPISKLEVYYKWQRKERFESGVAIAGTKLRKRLHGVMIFCLAIDRILTGRKITIIGNQFKKSESPVIYACTHVGRYDIETALEKLVPEQAYFLMGDPGTVYKSFEGILLYMNGTVFVDTADKEDRYIGKETCIQLLEQGANILIYPEGAWNVSENQVVMPLFTGTAEMAIRTGAQIVPIAIEQYGKHYYANIGENIQCDGMEWSQIQELTVHLRDVLCTLKWDIWEQFKPVSRSSLPSDAAEQFLEGIMCQTENGYTLDEIHRTRFHTKEEIEQKDVYNHLDKLIPCSRNAFLFRKR